MQVTPGCLVKGEIVFVKVVEEPQTVVLNSVCVSLSMAAVHMLCVCVCVYLSMTAVHMFSSLGSGCSVGKTKQSKSSPEDFSVG